MTAPVHSCTLVRKPHAWLASAQGFTLIEVLVAISIMALLALMSWQGIDSMMRAQEQTRALGDESMAWQVGLAQWRSDLDALIDWPAGTGVQSLDWNGQTLRMTRHTLLGTESVMVVVAWGVRETEQGSRWLRWQSVPVHTRGEWSQAWAQAAQWGQNPGAALREREVNVAAAQGWQVFYFRGNAWTNPLSSSAGAGSGAGSNPDLYVPLPEGVRVVLNVPGNNTLAGTLVLDWASPTLGGSR